MEKVFNHSQNSRFYRFFAYLQKDVPSQKSKQLNTNKFSHGSLSGIKELILLKQNPRLMMHPFFNGYAK